MEKEEEKEEDDDDDDEEDDKRKGIAQGTRKEEEMCETEKTERE